MSPRYRQGAFHLQRLCEEPGCDEEHAAFGKCSRHYQEARRKGLTSAPKCSIDGCEDPVAARGWCKKHLARYYRTGSPLKVRKRQPPPKTAWARKKGTPRPPRVAAPINDKWVREARCSAQPRLFDTCEQAAEAKAICAQCPVRTECLQHAIANKISHGIRGGHTPRERQEIAKVA